jgi:hypothetical protein
MMGWMGARSKPVQNKKNARVNVGTSNAIKHDEDRASSSDVSLETRS